MSAKKKAATKAADSEGVPITPTLKALKANRANLDQPAAPDTREPHQINSSLSSDRMKALLADHRAMGGRPKK